jgi:hypothetical protein
MNKYESNRNAMLKAVGNVFGKYVTDIANIPALQTCVTEYAERNQEISLVLMVKEGKTTGVAEQKQKEEKEMIDETVRIGAALYVYSLDHSDFELASKVNISSTMLDHLNQTKLPAYCRNILNLLQKYISEMTPYGISNGDVAKLEKEISDFEQIVAMPRNMIVTRSEANGRLATLMKTQCDLLNQKIDKLMLAFKTKNPIFYNEYKIARIIVHMGMRHVSSETEEQGQTTAA